MRQYLPRKERYMVQDWRSLFEWVGITGGFGGAAILGILKARAAIDESFVPLVIFFSFICAVGFIAKYWNK